MARHRGAVLVAWALLLGVCLALYPTLKSVLSEPDYTIEGSESAQVARLLSGPTFHGAGDEQDVIVFFSSQLRALSPAYRKVVARALRAAHSQQGVASILGPYSPRAHSSQISADGHAALALLALKGGDRERFKDAENLQSATARASGSGVHAWLTGYSALSKDVSLKEAADGQRGEEIGVPLALVVLVLALGAAGAAVVPLLLAGSSLLLTYAVIAVLGRIVNFDVFLLTVVTMVGVGIGIDYSLFIVSRFREELARSPAVPRRERRRIAQAVGVAVATSGRTVLYSGVIVALSLTSLLVIRAPLFREFAIGTAVSVICTLTAALTLLPAVLAQLGPRINAGALPSRLQPANARLGVPEGQGGWARWAMVMMRRPATAALAVSLLLALAISPVFGLRLGVALDLGAFSSTPSGKGAQVLARSFRAGMILPLEVLVSGGAEERGHSSASGAPAARMLARELRTDRRVAAVAPHVYRNGVLLTVVLGVPVDSVAARALVQHARAQLAPAASSRYGVRVLVGGWPAQSLDVVDESTRKLPLVLAITLGIALVFLLFVLRSVVLPLKAVLMNLLATAATLGLVVLIFQQGHGSGLLGFSSPGFIQAYLPLVMFVLLFGLSMDYEVFLIRRMQEAWHRTSDNRLAVAVGVEHTARPISAAAAIMVAVFGSGITASVLELKQFGFALAAAIAIDATLIRLVLVPALMCLLGTRNWWLPAPLARVLPRLELD